MSFFHKLREGVSTIESEVKKLKDITEEGNHLSEEQMRDNLMKAKNFDSEIRRTYSEVSQLLNTMKSCGDLLFESKNEILSIKQMLCDIENNSGLKKFGYKPFNGHYFVGSDNDNLAQLKAEEEEEEEEQIERSFEEQNNENTLNVNKWLTKELKQKTNISEDRNTQTVRFAADMPIVVNRNEDNSRKPMDNNETQKRDLFVNKKYEKLLSRTPQPHDFGITRRFTFLPQIYNNNKMEAKNTPEEPVFDSTQTCRFNYINNGLNFDSVLNQLTPPKPLNNNNNNNNNGDSFVTVEFTPGLTTKRPKGVSRVANNKSNEMNKTMNVSNKQNDYQKWTNTTNTQRLPQSVLQSVENDKITPEQPIPMSDSSKSVNILRSIVGKGSGTPPPPKSRIDANFHNQILKHL